jgi:hypothetical protein
MPKAPVQEKMVETPILMAMIGTSMSPCASGDRANEARP